MIESELETARERPEFEHITSDRCTLLSLAIHLIDAFQPQPGVESFQAAERTLQEDAAYRSALNYAAREFDKGAVEAYTIATRDSRACDDDS